MNTSGTDQILQTLDDLSRLEATMAAYYLACSEKWEAKSPLWMELALEEERHEKIIDDLAKLVKAYPDEFKSGLAVESTAISSFVDNISERTTDVMKGQVTFSAALTFALGIEESIIEGRFFEIVISDNQRYLKFMQAMSEDLNQHRQRIVEEMEKVSER